MGDQEDDFDVDSLIDSAEDDNIVDDGQDDEQPADSNNEETSEDEIAFGESTSSMLNQGEIDEILGYEDQESEEKSSSEHGIDKLIEAGVVAYERMPMLEVVYDRLVRVLSTSLRNFTSDNVEVTLSSIDTTRFGNYTQSISMPALLAIFKAKA